MSGKLDNGAAYAINEHALFWLHTMQAKLSAKAAYALYNLGIDTLAAFQKITRKQLHSCGIKAEKAQALQNTSALQLLKTDHNAWLAQQNHHLIYLGHPQYPELLYEITDPPQVIYAQGDIHLLQQTQIALVGSRYPTPTGKQDAFAFAAHLAQSGLVVTSGMAAGVDSAAHLGALSQGKSIAVLGTGIDISYPKTNHALHKKLATEGLVISSFLLGSAPLARHFPIRNRIISAMSLGVLVIEASLKSGSLITARLALEQNKEVFALPGSIHNPLVKGNHYLIKQGAALVESTADIMQALPVDARMYGQSDRSQNKPPQDKQNSLLSGDEQLVWQQLDTTPATADLLVARTGMSIDRLLATLLTLEIKQCAYRVGDRYAKK